MTAPSVDRQLGCARPRLLSFGESAPIVLSGGRNMVQVLANYWAVEPFRGALLYFYGNHGCNKAPLNESTAHGYQLAMGRRAINFGRRLFSTISIRDSPYNVHNAASG